MKANSEFKFYTPISSFEKSKKDGKDVYYFEGKASDTSEDSDGHSLSPSVFDFSEFKYVNWDHGKGPGDIIGEKIDHRIVGDEVMVRGLIYPDLPKGKETIDLMKALERSPNKNRLGISVEGQVLERDLITKVPTRAKITSIALCPFPKNGNTWATLIEKSKNGEPLTQEPEVLVYEKEDIDEPCHFHFLDGTGNHIKIKEDFEWEVLKAQSTINSTALIKEDVEGNEKKLISVHSLVKAHQQGLISGEILEQVKEKAKNLLQLEKN